MAKLSTLGSPGVEVRVIDNSTRPSTSTASTAYLSGFAAQGPVEEVIRVSKIDEFVNIYGEPTNAAERYFYYQARAFLSGTSDSATLYTSRLPYGSGKGDTVATAYTVMAYPALPVIANPSYPSFNHRISDENAKTLLTISYETDDETEQVAPTDGSISTSVLLTNEAGAELTSITPNEDKTALILTLSYGDDEDTVKSSPADIAVNNNGVCVFKFVIEKSTDKPNAPAGIISLTAKYEAETIKDIIGGLVKGTSTFGASTLPLGVGTEEPRFTVADNYLGETNKVQSIENDEEYTESADKTKLVAEDVTYLIGAPVTYQLSVDEYNKLISGESLEWQNGYGNTDFNTDEFAKYKNINKAAFLVFNTSRAIVNEDFEGFYLGFSDNMFVNPAEELDDQDNIYYNAVEEVRVTTSTMKQGTSLADSFGLYDKYDETGAFSKMNDIRLSFDCAGNGAGSISRIMERSMTPMDISSTDYDDTLSIGLFKLNRSTTNTETLKLSYSIREHFNGAFGKKRVKSSEQATTPVSYFIEKIVADDSNNIAVMVNPYISNKIHIDLNGNLRGKVRVFGSKLEDNLTYYENKYVTSNPKAYELLIKQSGLDMAFINTLNNGLADTTKSYEFFTKLDSMYPLGVYTTVSNADKVIGNVPYKVQRALELVENDEEYPDIDLVIDGGLSTIYPYSKTTNGKGFNENVQEGSFNENLIFEALEDLRTSSSAYSEDTEDFVNDYNAVQQTFLKFCNSQANGGRGDSFFVGDILRGIVIKGKNTKVQNLYGQPLINAHYTSNDRVNHSWSTSVYYPIKHSTDQIVSTYASLYAQWFKEDDVFSGQKVWLPSSAYVAASMAATDTSRGPWYAAAGLNRGVITGPIDYALNPTVSQRTDLYKICINSIPKLPNAGVTIWGIRTMSKKPTAFDQNTCVRTFLYMEKRLKQYLRYYLFEPNTSYTRLAIYNDIQPFMESVKVAGGVYDYTVVCDGTNNTADVINNGDLAVDVSAAPTRTAENIVLTMTANRYTGDVTVG